VQCALPHSFIATLRAFSNEIQFGCKNLAQSDLANSQLTLRNAHMFEAGIVMIGLGENNVIT
jgi:hypothetical protein